MVRCVIGMGGSAEAWAQLKTELSHLGIEHPQFTKGPHGKPYLQGGAVSFNLSHSHGYYAVAVGESELGIDIETVRAVRLKLAPRFFAPSEAERVNSEDDFLRLWTGKESYLKYLGTGLATPLSSFDVETVPAHFARYEGEGYFVCLCTKDEVQVEWMDKTEK